MKYFITIFVTCLALCRLHAQMQTIEGTVYDAQTKETIPGVVVYLNGTSIITTSDKDGHFQLAIEQEINTNLVFSHLSYESFVMEPPFDDTQKAFFLKEKVNTIDAVVVQADRTSLAFRETWMNMFREHFLGTSMAGRSCIISNEADIMLHYDREANTLTAYAYKPIVVENKYLGYRITFDLHHFNIQYTQNRLGVLNPTQISCTGTSSFVDLNPHDIRLTARRNETYIRSTAYFWKNLVAHTLKETRFKIYHQGRQVEPNQYFTVIDIVSRHIVYIKPAAHTNRHYEGINGPVYGEVRVVHSNKFDSDLVFLTPRFSIDVFGNIDAFDKVVFFGDMGNQRLGDMLPMNFTYTQAPSSRSRR